MSDLPGGSAGSASSLLQCQRTRRYLPAGGGHVECCWCEERETYRRLETHEEAWLHVQAAMAMCRGEFEVADDGLSTEIWLGSGPETVFEAGAGGYNIYLGRGSDRWQFMYSGAHEAFHRVCGEGKNRSDWADEMFAVHFSLIYLERIGETDHAERNRRHLVEQAARCSVEELFRLGEGVEPVGIYGRAYLVGLEIVEAVGWEALRPLATMRRSDGRCDVETWLATLGPRRAATEAVFSRRP